MSNKTVFAKLIISQLASSIGTNGSSFSSSTPTAAQAAVANAITSFITTYVWSKTVYTGIMISYPNPPDPVVADDHPVLGVCAPTGTPSDLSGWLSELSKNIRDGFYNGPGILGVTFAGVYKPFGGAISVTTKDLQPIHENNWEDPQLAVWEAICQAIIDMLINNVSGQQCSAVRPGQSTGTAPAFVSYNYIQDSGANRGRRRSQETIIGDDYLDWDIDTWNDYNWG